MDKILLGGPMLLLIAIPSCLAIDTAAYHDLASLYPATEKTFKFEAESEEGGQLYDLPQLKDFGLTKTPGHCHHRHQDSNESSNYFKFCPNYCNV